MGFNGNLTWWALDQMAIQVEAEWKNKSYSAISITKYSNPMSANISMAWYPTDNIQISAGITYLGGIREQITTIDTPNYYQRQRCHSIVKVFALGYYLHILSESIIN